jgi:hypothetical protein
MTVRRVALLVGVAVLVLVANVAISIVYMVVYGHLINPGHVPQYYNDHIQVAGPYCSIVAGIPLMFLAGWWVAAWWRRALGVRPAWIVWGAYTAIDLAVLLAAGPSIGVGLLFIASSVTKLAAVHFGARLRLARPAEPDPATSGGRPRQAAPVPGGPGSLCRLAETGAGQQHPRQLATSAKATPRCNARIVPGSGDRAIFGKHRRLSGCRSDIADGSRDPQRRPAPLIARDSGPA